MDQRSASEEQAMREAHVDKLVSVAALGRINRLVQRWDVEHKAKHRVAKRLLMAAGTLFVLVAAVGLFKPSLLTAAVRCAAAVVR